MALLTFLTAPWTWAVCTGSWLANIGASAILYASAGLFWSLDWRPERGATFSFLEPEWPTATRAGTSARWWATPSASWRSSPAH
jgi:hypothetical protein